MGQVEAREFQARGLEEKVREAEELAARLPLEVISMTMVCVMIMLMKIKPKMKTSAMKLSGKWKSWQQGFLWR